MQSQNKSLQHNTLFERICTFTVNQSLMDLDTSEIRTKMGRAVSCTRRGHFSYINIHYSSEP